MYCLFVWFFFAYTEFREIHHLMDNVCTVRGLLPGKTYSFRVKALNDAGVRVNTRLSKSLCIILM